MDRIVTFLALTALLSACSGSAEPSGLPEIPITVDAEGYHPTEATAPAGERVRLVFKRTTDEGCGQQLVFPGLGIRKDLPLDEEVPVDITMPPSGSVAFTCGMDMYRGSVVVR
ncbi:MAG: cupredoxin domain-containing protein [Polyangiaceae bacterium]|nr:cupredoxin domain-containing protein [Polyangiaceae bacterium]